MGNNINNNDPLGILIGIVFSRKLIIIIGFISVFSITVIGAILMPPDYEAYTTVQISAPTLPKIVAPYMNEISGRTFLTGQVAIIKSRIIYEKVVMKLQLYKIKKPRSFLKKIKDKIYQALRVSKPVPDPVEGAIEYLRESTSVRLSRGSNIVTISSITRVPEQSALLANTLGETYVEYANSSLFATATSGYAFIEKKAYLAREKLAESEKALNEFKERRVNFSIVDENSNISKKMAEANEKYQQIQMIITNLKRQGSALQYSGEQYTSPEMQEMSKQLKQLKEELAEALVYYTNDHPDVKILHNKIAKIETRLKSGDKISLNKETENLKANEINKLQFQANYLSNQIKKLLKRREELTKRQITLEKLTHEFRNNQKKLLIIENQLENASMLKANEMKKGSIKILDQAYPPIFSSTKKKKILVAIGTIVAIIFSLGMAVFVEYLDDSLKSVDETENYLNLPVLGIVPEITRKLRKI